MPDFLTWFEPLAEAIGVHQQQARVVHGDETSWVVHVRAEADANPRCWLWACLSRDAVLFRVDPSRSAVAAGQLFGALGRDRRVVLVCDRYSAYVKLAREHPGQFELAVCWVHVRRDFVTLGRKRPDLQAWVEGIVARIGKLYQRNAERLAAWDPEGCPQGQSEQFQAAQERLEAEFETLFEQAGKEQRALSAAAGKPPGGGPPDPRLGPLQSLLKHRQGLTVFVAKPFVAMDNNPVERALRRWLEAFLGECAGIGPQAVVVDPQAWLPWGLPRERLPALLRPGLPGCRTGSHPRADRAARPAPVPHGAVPGGLRGAGLAQARWRPQGDECAHGPAAHAARRPADAAAAVADRAATAVV